MSKIKKFFWICFFFCSVLFFSFQVVDYIFPLPEIKRDSTQTILAEDGTLLWRFADKDGIWRYPIQIEEVSSYYLEALINYEDRWFYYHPGINVFSLIRALLQNISSGKIVSGASTLTMQVARIIEPHSKSILGKIKQMFRALQLEWHFSKKEILLIYLNRAPFGRNLEGIGAAAWFYLQKTPKNLTRGDAVLLAVLPQAPSLLRPDRYPARAEKARNKVLNQLQKFGVWPDNIIQMIQQEPVWIPPYYGLNHAPLLARRLSNQFSNQNIITSGINFSIQHNLEKIAENYKYFSAPKTSMAILVVDYSDMLVKGYVGSIDFNDVSRSGQVDMVRAIRSPGSTLKPFLFAFALDEGLIHSESLLQDVPRIVSDYRPKNFSKNFMGPVSASEALQRSLNLPFVQLLEILGPNRFASLLTQTGIHLRSKGNKPNLSYILGGGSTSLEELVSGYSLFARQGKAAKLRFVKSDPLVEKQIISSGAAWITNYILIREENNPYILPYSSEQLAWKSGTSYDFRDAWAIGYNGRYLIGIWVGRPDGSPVPGQYARKTVLPILMKVHQFLVNYDQLTNRKPIPFPKPATVSRDMICWPTGRKMRHENKAFCYKKIIAFLLNEMTPGTFANLYPEAGDYGQTVLTFWVNNQGQRVASYCKGARKKQVAVWPAALDAWVKESERQINLIPSVDSWCAPKNNLDNFSQLKIVGIDNGQHIRTLSENNYLTVTLKALGGFGVHWWFLDGKFVQSSKEKNEIKINLNSKKQTGKHDLVVLDEKGQIAKVSFSVD